MLEKNEIHCISIMKKGPFFHEYLVCIGKEPNVEQKFQLRVMNKRYIVQDKIDEEMVMNELYVRSNLRSFFIINQLLAFQDYDALFHLTEHAPIQLLNNRSLPRQLEMEAVRFYAAEIFLGLKYLHSRQQIYTFLSPLNILVALDGHIKLDYAFCNSFNENNEYMVKYIEYASLEYLTRNDFTHCSDYWSLGVVLYRLAVGYTPFGTESYEDTVNNMLKGNLEFPYFIQDEDFKQLVRLLLGQFPGARMGTSPGDSEIIVNHPFFAAVNWEKAAARELVPPHTFSIKSVSSPKLVPLSKLYTSDFIVGDKDGYGSTFAHYEAINFL